MIYNLGTEEFPLLACNPDHTSSSKAAVSRLKPGAWASDFCLVIRDTKLGIAEVCGFFIESDSRKSLAFQRTLNTPIASVSS
jgi:hypothetical protein